MLPELIVGTESKVAININLKEENKKNNNVSINTY